MNACPTCGAPLPRGVVILDEDVAQAVDRLGVPRYPAILFLVLWSRIGRTMSYDLILDQMQAYLHDPISLGSLATAKKRLVKALKDEPVKIRTEYGLGYRMELDNRAWMWR